MDLYSYEIMHQAWFVLSAVLLSITIITVITCAATTVRALQAVTLLLLANSTFITGLLEYLVGMNALESGITLIAIFIANIGIWSVFLNFETLRIGDDSDPSVN